MQRFWSRYKQQKPACAGLGILILWVSLGIFAPSLSPHNPIEQNPALRYQSPCPKYLFGTDQFGRDVLSRMLFGARLSLGLGLSITGMALFIGIMLGAAAGLLGGIWDAIIMRSVDLLLAFPVLFLLIACIAMFGSEISVFVLILVLTSWMDLARVVRAEVSSLKQRDFIKSAYVLGFSKTRILFAHLLPNLLPPIIAIAVLRIADIILIESSLSFLGLGIQPPGISWGNIIRDGRDVLATAWWITTFPGLAITLTAISFHWIGDGIRKAAG